MRAAHQQRPGACASPISCVDRATPPAHQRWWRLSIRDREPSQPTTWAPLTSSRGPCSPLWHEGARLLFGSATPVPGWQATSRFCGLEPPQHALGWLPCSRPPGPQATRGLDKLTHDCRRRRGIGHSSRSGSTDERAALRKRCLNGFYNLYRFDAERQPLPVLEDAADYAQTGLGVRRQHRLRYRSTADHRGHLPSGQRRARNCCS